MTVEEPFFSLLIAALIGLASSVMIERLMKPCPALRRPWQAWAIHIGLWLLAHGLVTLLLGRPWFATTVVSAVLLTLVLVNNAKKKALRESFVYQDYEYFTDMLRHPRLYIPFMGWCKFLLAATGFVLAIVVGIYWESPPYSRFSLSNQLGAVVGICCLGSLLLGLAHRTSFAVSLNPEHDLKKLGLLASLWSYRKQEKQLPLVSSPFNAVSLRSPVGKLPQLVAVQSESFFDPRAMYQGIRTDLLSDFDRIKRESIATGKLFVPAWGANTVRSEFGFLSGISAEKLGVHRFNPYRAIAFGWEVSTLTSYLKSIGYRTVCLHPYPESFYRRDLVFPTLGFDEFVDIRSFDAAKRFGPYIGDLAVADTLAEILDGAKGPVFVFVITMENHGPLHLERVVPSDIDELYSVSPPSGCEDLTVYLRHLRNANRMISKICGTMERCEKPASLCWYGDHVPIMPGVYSRFGEPTGKVEYCIWRNCNMESGVVRDVPVEELAFAWLRYLNLLG